MCFPATGCKGKVDNSLMLAKVLTIYYDFTKAHKLILYHMQDYWKNEMQMELIESYYPELEPSYMTASRVL